MLDARFVYLFYGLLFTLAWLVLFISRNDLRQPMLIMSAAIAPLGPLSEIWYLQDYWKSVTLTGTAVGIEDLIFGFAIGGIAVALYPAAFNKQFSKMNLPAPNLAVLLMFAASFVVCLVVGTSLLHINSIFTSVVAFGVTAAFIVYWRRDLLKPALLSGMLSFVLFVTVYYLMRIVYPPLLEAWCTGCNPSGIVLFGVNLEELIWDASWGVAGGILYPAIAGYALTSRAAVLRHRQEQSGTT